VPCPPARPHRRPRLQSYVRPGGPGQWVFITSWIVSLVFLIALMCSTTLRRKHPWNLLALAAFTLVESVLVGVICAYWQTSVSGCGGHGGWVREGGAPSRFWGEVRAGCAALWGASQRACSTPPPKPPCPLGAPQVVLEAFAVTCAAVAGLTLVAVFGKFDLTKKGNVLFMISMVVFMVGRWGWGGSKACPACSQPLQQGIKGACRLGGARRRALPLTCSPLARGAGGAGDDAGGLLLRGERFGGGSSRAAARFRRVGPPWRRHSPATHAPARPELRVASTQRTLPRRCSLRLPARRTSGGTSRYLWWWPCSSPPTSCTTSRW
jgi:hypothetical protein